MKKSKIFLMLIMVLFLGSTLLYARDGEQNKGEVVVLDKADFLTKVYNYEKNENEWIYEGDKPCIVDFYADWCGPCRQVSPILKQLAEQYKDRIVVYKVNVDKEKELAMAFGIQSIPTFLFVPVNGEPQLALGAFPKETFEKQIKTFLLGEEEWTVWNHKEGLFSKALFIGS